MGCSCLKDSLAVCPYHPLEHEKIEVLVKRIAELEDQLAEAREDRARLEWMAAKEGVIERHPNRQEWCVAADGMDYHTDWRGNWRDAIDEAMSQEASDKNFLDKPKNL